MSHAYTIPPVSLEDLQSFRAKHFPTSPNPQPTIPPTTQTKPETLDTSAFALPETDAQDEDPNDLGYYPDGVKRTLTDEQIRIFRHSEIHALLRERQLQRENEEYERRFGERAGDAQDGAGDEGVATEKEEHEASSGSGSASNPAAASPAQNDGNVRAAAPGTKRPADGAGSNGPIAKRKSKSNAPGDVFLDYNELEHEETGSRQSSRGQATSQFTGRKIISYDD